MASIMIVDAEQLLNTPKAFRDYVAQYFRESVVLGKRVFVATQLLHLDSWRHYGLGYAPRHSVDLMCFKDGLPSGESLNDWMRNAEGTLLWTFAGGFDSDNVVYCD